MPGHYLEGAIKRRLNASGKGLLSALVQSFRSLACSSDFHQSCQTSALWPAKGRTFTTTMLRDLRAQTWAFTSWSSSLGQTSGGLLLKALRVSKRLHPQSPGNHLLCGGRGADDGEHKSLYRKQLEKPEWCFNLKRAVKDEGSGRQGVSINLASSSKMDISLLASSIIPRHPH